MLRNREIKTFLMIYLVILIIFFFIALYTTITSVQLILSLGVLSIVLYAGFTLYRYNQIKQLSTYIREISNGNYSLDVRDNVEGELSILKNEIYKVTSTLAEQSNALQKDKIHLTDAISDISHQLKTPLTSMTMMADLLASPTLPAHKRTEFSSLLLTQLERIEWLVSSLLTLSKIDAGTVTFKKEDVCVGSLIERALEGLRTSIDEKNIDIQLIGDDDLLLSCDPNWTTEAFVNIIHNCMQHSPANESIHIDWEKNARFTQITVRDHGPGIPKEERAHLFKRFYKGSHASDDSVGIGLAMAYSMITNQHGDIVVDSERGEGTSFQITFYHTS